MLRLFHGTWKNMHPPATGWSVPHVCDIQVVRSVVQVLFLYWSSGWCSIHYWKQSSKIFNHYFITAHFFPQFCQCLPHSFWGSDFWCIFVYNCYIILVNWSISIHNALLCLWSSLHLKYILADVGIVNSLFVTVNMKYLFHLFTLIWLCLLI